jgi:diketogulonate reductase-like aldo/keto reductase
MSATLVRLLGGAGVTGIHPQPGRAEAVGVNAGDSHVQGCGAYRGDMTTSPTPSLTLNNGIEIPAIGLGVFQTPPEETVAAVASALRTGYRHIDTAAAYLNEREVGQGIRQSGIERADIFIETKIWISDYGHGETLHAFQKSAAKLGVDYIDLLILHQALPSAFDKTVGAYRALEQLLAEGKVRAIGVSNFMPEHLNHPLAQTDVVPAVNQIEVHPYFQQKELQELHQQHGILTQAWSPIGGITSYRGDSEKLLSHDAYRKLTDPDRIAGGTRHLQQGPGRNYHGTRWIGGTSFLVANGQLGRS